MKFRLLSILCSFFLFLNIFGEQKPHAYIVKWAPSVAGSRNFGFRANKGLPIWVTIGFDKAIATENLDQYLKFLGNRSFKINVIGTTKHPGRFLINTLQSREEIESILIKANKHFDPNFKTSAELMIEQHKQKEKGIRKIEDERRAEIIRMEKEQEAKIENERRAKIEAERKTRIEKELIAQKKEAEEKQKLKNDQRIKQQINATYTLVTLPKNFSTREAKSVMNNHGQIAGYIFDGSMCNAAIWNSLNREITLLNYEGHAIAINDNKYAVLQCRGAKSLLINTENNQVIFGPAGIPDGISNSNIIWIRLNGSSSLIWDTENNTVAMPDLGTRNYRCMNSQGQLYMKYLPGALGSTFNIRGFNNNLKVLCGSGTNLFLLSNETYCGLASPAGTIDSASAHINDLDEVVALTEVSRDKKTVYKITKWLSDKKTIVSDILNDYEELEKFNLFSILGFTNSGLILLSAQYSQYSNQSFFLLVPKK